MRIANPIYDVVFKHLMQDEGIAILILSTILGEEIIDLDLLPQETSVPMENRSFTVYRLDFSAHIKTPDGKVKHVIIEIQKAKFAADIMRFRRYLGAQYSQRFTLERAGKVQKTIPIIISIYFLGYKLEHVVAPVIKVLRHYYDAATGEEIPAREAFIESLTHDSFVIQIPYLGPERKTATERLLAIFDQHLRVAGDEHILDIDEETYPEEYRQVIRWLNRAVSEPAIRRTMDVEDEILAELEDMERRIAGMGKSIEEKDKTIEEKDKTIGEKEKTIEEKDKALEEKEQAFAKALEEKDRLIARLQSKSPNSGEFIP
uniref:PD-(D/E)XK nuclease family transposase n=1 Tax=Candidatus Kentrum eta TaxID=2126337 RepID=A0A450UM56_9GAMM|nr:MAG: PD-(D/E)XK nuclease family transposase [Candidatus Kentron sp. H]VFJ94046.1 MAG: PD-(D/E)XK nuclease family transposase [Candidatus Kentron sp. H]VFK01253.1 MAG: PD-(D/E)XK nuclease family transposase [Candidatus Kentron sp. H]